MKPGWEGSMDFKAAAKRLRDVQLNRKEEEIFIHKDDSFIVVDFDKGTSALSPLSPLSYSYHLTRQRGHEVPGAGCALEQRRLVRLPVPRRRREEDDGGLLTLAPCPRGQV